MRLLNSSVMLRCMRRSLNEFDFANDFAVDVFNTFDER